MSLHLTASRLLSRRVVAAWTARRSLASSAAAPWSESLSYASPESDFTGARNLTTTVRVRLAEPEQQRQNWSETLSFASPESDFSAALANAQRVADMALPLTWKDALHIDHQVAMVITTAQAPHKVVHVNAAWETLCGYTKSEALLHPIGPLLQNDQHKSQTNLAARHLVQQLREDHYTVEHDAYLENFTKTGRPFLNHLRVGPLYLEDHEAAAHEKPDFLVAFLEEVERQDVPLRLVVA